MPLEWLICRDPVHIGGADSSTRGNNNPIFRLPDRTPAIPGSSLRGALREHASINYPDRVETMKPGRPTLVEFEYIRHGTQTLIASLNVATGRVDQATVGDTRTEADFEAHVRQLLAQFPEASKIHLVVDCLNTHIGIPG